MVFAFIDRVTDLHSLLETLSLVQDGEAGIISELVNKAHY